LRIVPRVLEGAVEYPSVKPAGITPEEAADRFVLLCHAQALTDITIETREMRPTPDVEVKSLPCRVERLARLADDVMAVHLRLPAVEELHFLPGQYVDVMLPDGRRRSFSLANAPSDGRLLELHVRRASASGFTGQVFDSIERGALLRIEGPLGQFWLRADSPRQPLMIAGGTGYAPLRAMLRQLITSGDRREPAVLGRARQPTCINRWLRDSRPLARFVYRPVLSNPAPDDSAIQRTGWVHEAAGRLRFACPLRRLCRRTAGDDRAIRATFQRGLPRTSSISTRSLPRIRWPSFSG
jgi:CDP-4-dehydro-6-deoxyglucose reductase